MEIKYFFANARVGLSRGLRTKIILSAPCAQSVARSYRKDKTDAEVYLKLLSGKIVEIYEIEL
jgi:hypothetical protein